MAASKQKKHPNIVSHPELEDATERFDFTIFKKHVTGSVVRDKHDCAAARALRDVPGVEDAWVMTTVTFIQFKDGRLLRYSNPKHVANHVRDFDWTAGLFPEGDYYLNPVPQSQVMGTRQKYANYGKNAKDRKNPQRKLHHSYSFR